MEFVFASVADRFPVGTSVAAYPRSNWPAWMDGPSGAPVGSATESATVQADGSLAFTALAEDVQYVAYALVGGEHRYRAFSTLRPRGAAQIEAANSWQGPQTFEDGITVVGVVAADELQWASASGAQATVGTAGAAAALPATPAKYLKVKDSTGAVFVVPAYAAS